MGISCGMEIKSLKSAEKFMLPAFRTRIGEGCVV
jgi:hypothetical protein